MYFFLNSLSFTGVQIRDFILVFLLLMLWHLALFALQASVSNLALPIAVLLTAPPSQLHCLKLKKLKVMIGNPLLC